MTKRDKMPDWSAWETHVLAEIARLNQNIERVLAAQSDLTKKYFDLKEEVAVIKIKVAFFATAFGFVGSAVIPLLQWATNLIH